MHNQAIRPQSQPPSHSPLGPERAHSAHPACPPLLAPAASTSTHRQSESHSYPPPTVLLALREPAARTQHAPPYLHSQPLHAQIGNPTPIPTPLPHSSWPRESPQRTPSLPPLTCTRSHYMHTQAIPTPSKPPSHSPLGPERAHSAHPACPPLLAPAASTCTHRQSQPHSNPHPTVLSAPRVPTARTQPTPPYLHP